MNRPVSLFSPNLLLRVEDFALLAAAVTAYSRISPDWLLFAVLFFAPDVAMIGYLRDTRIGSLIYNIGHWLALTLAVTALGLATGSLLVVHIGLIWTAHVVFDRVMGYGLKYPTEFKDTHMQHV